MDSSSIAVCYESYDITRNVYFLDSAPCDFLISTQIRQASMILYEGYQYDKEAALNYFISYLQFLRQ